MGGVRTQKVLRSHSIHDKTVQGGSWDGAFQQKDFHALIESSSAARFLGVGVISGCCGGLGDPRYTRAFVVGPWGTLELLGTSLEHLVSFWKAPGGPWEMPYVHSPGVCGSH